MDGRNTKDLSPSMSCTFHTIRRLQRDGVPKRLMKRKKKKKHAYILIVRHPRTVFSLLVRLSHGGFISFDFVLLP